MPRRSKGLTRSSREEGWAVSLEIPVGFMLWVEEAASGTCVTASVTGEFAISAPL